MYPPPSLKGLSKSFDSRRNSLDANILGAVDQINWFIRGCYVSTTGRPLPRRGHSVESMDSLT